MKIEAIITYIPTDDGVHGLEKLLQNWLIHKSEGVIIEIVKSELETVHNATSDYIGSRWMYLKCKLLPDIDLSFQRYF